MQNKKTRGSKVDDDFEIQFMWKDLAYLFARRDAVAEIDEKMGLLEEELPPETFPDSMAKRVRMYLKEFQKNGINNLECSNVKKNFLKVKEIKKN